MDKFEESNFYKALQDFFINADKKTFLQFLAEFYNRTEGIIDKDNIQDDLIKELRELYLEFNEKGIDENIVREKVNYFVENNVKIKDINSKLNTNINNIKNINSQLDANTNNIKNINSQLDTNTNNIENNTSQLEHIYNIKADKTVVNSLQSQFDSAIANVTNGNETATNTEIVQARTSTFGNNFTTLNKRIDATELINFQLNESKGEIAQLVDTIKTFEPQTWNNTSTNFVGFAILFKAPRMIEKIKGFILSDNEGTAYCEIADESGNIIAKTSKTVKANATDYTTFDFGYLNTSMYTNIWVRFYGDGTLVPRRCTYWKNAYFDRSNIPTTTDKYVAYKQGNSWIPHNDYNYSIPTKFTNTVYGKRVNEIHVGTSGYKFTSLKTAIEYINDSNVNNVYNVYIHNDIDLYEEFGGDNWYSSLLQSNGFMQGLFLPDYVNLIGVGDVSISYLAPDNLATSTNVPCVSTLNLSYNNEIENLKIYGKNVRYVIHDETNNEFHNLKRKFKNCYIEHLGNKDGTWNNKHTLGCGCGSNCYYEYNNCKFVNTVAPYLMHNNTNQKPTTLVFNNCEFIGWKDKGCVSLSGLSGTSTPCHAIFNNCKLSGWIATTRDIWNVTGGGNTECAYMMNQSTDNKIRVMFNDEVKTIRNIASSTITKFTPVMLDGGYLNKIPTGQEYRFYGIALENATGGNITTVKYRGYIDITSLNIATADGDKIGVVNGALAKVTGNDFIGVVSKQDSSYFLILK